MKNLIIVSLCCVLGYVSADCWKQAYGRGVGTVITSCPADQEKNGALCYPWCKEGFYGVGPVCWQSCPSGFPDTGVDCLKPSAYGRGVGYPLWDEGKCNRENSQGCEKWGLIWYPKCRENFHNVACCICSPDCKLGMTDIGVSCQKDSYGRGVGEPLICAPGLQEQAALCYKPCKSGFHGNGPLCWENCPSGTYECGALCTDDADECTDTVKSTVQDVITLAAQIAVSLTGDVDMMSLLLEIGKVALDLSSEVCPAPEAIFFY